MNRSLLERLSNSKLFLSPTELTMDTFDELEVLRLLPMVISFMKANALSSLEQDAFEHIYGSIWELVVEESHRYRGQPRNAILTALLASPEIRQTSNPKTNDPQHNSIPPPATYASREAPSQRVLHMAATIVQKYYQRQTKHTSASKRKATQARRNEPRLRSADVRTKQLSSDSIRVTIELPRYKRAIAKPKQSPTKQKAKEEVHEEEDEEEDPEMEAKILAAIQAQIGNPSLEEEDDEEDDDTAALGEDSSEYLDDEPDYMGVLGDDDDDDDVDDDDTEEYEEDDDGHLVNGLLRTSMQDFENPSFNELLLLAARHRAAQQRRQKQQQHHLAHRMKPSATLHSSYEDY